MKSQIIHEDKDIIVIYKPAGLAAQSAKVTQADVVSEICGYLKSPYVGLVHRLDQPVEGLMVLAKTKAAAGALSAQLTKGELKKTYLAVVSDEREGAEQAGQTKMSEEWTELTDYLVKDSKAGKAEVLTKEQETEHRNKGKEGEKASKATLFYRRICGGEGNTALMEIKLITGRFHQIRAQMAHAGMPLLGDVKYGSGQSKALTQQIGEKVLLKDVALCAYKLSFVHPGTKKSMEFEIRPKKPVFNSYHF